jgi:hypothetical protein
MKVLNNAAAGVLGLLAMLCAAPASATVAITSFNPSAAPPQPIGKTIVWTVTATDTNPNQLAFQFNVTAPGATSSSVVIDYNVGGYKSGIWTSQPFDWVPEACVNAVENNGVVALTCQGIEGRYSIQVNVMDFTSGESATETVTFEVNPLITGTTPLTTATSNPLIALFSAPSCAAGSDMRVSFQQTGTTPPPATTTNWVPCHPPATMNFEIAGMYPTTTYNMFAQTVTGTTIVNGPTVTFTTGAMSSKVPIPNFIINIPAGAQTDTAYPVLMMNPSAFGGQQIYANIATDLSGHIMWYYYPGQPITLTRPLLNGTILTIQSYPAWNDTTTKYQILQQVDLSGNIIRQTNTGIIQHQLVAMGATDAGPCSAVPSPPPVGSACLGGFHHDAIQTLPNGYTAVIASIEKIFPAGTQGNTTGLPVDIIGAILIVLDQNWQVKWYFDSFEHDTGGPNELNINRAAVLGETCITNESGCPPIFLLGPGVASKANDWLHPNAIYYWPADTWGGASGDLTWSFRNQDWVIKIDYNNGTGTGDILWILGLDGSFTFDNTNQDPYPWFSHQHEVGIENIGAGPMTIFDNGDTRIAPPPIGLGPTGCEPNDCFSRGMALTLNESTLVATPVLSQSLGYYSESDGSAQLLPDGNYFFQPGVVFDQSLLTDVAYVLEILPKAGTVNGTQVLNLQAQVSYRAWQMPSLYAPPIT